MQNKNILFSSIVSIICSSTLVVTGVILSSTSVKADVIDTVSVKVPVSCSMLVDSTANEPHRTSVENGIYRDDIGTTTVKAFCNDIEGLSIYAIGFTDEVSGKNVLASATLGETEDIVTGTAKAGATSNWAMKLNTDSTADYGIEITNGFNDYSEVPTEFTKVATRESGTDLGELAKGATFTTTYAVYINTRQPADTYAGKVKYIMLHPATEEPPHAIDTDPGYIGYYPNTSTTVGVMEKQAISDTDTSVMLTAPKFSREGYGFAGWNDKYDYSGNFYGPNETIDITAGQYSGENRGLSLYAVWIESEGSLQEWNSCGTMSIGDTTALTDVRDNNTYAIAKLADNKCWMIENIRIDNTVSRASMAANSQGIDSSFTTLPDSSNNWNTYNTTLPQINTNNLNNGNTIYGNYYSWPAAILDTTNYMSNNESVNTSICPLNWRLPVGGQTTVYPDSDYYVLMKNLTNSEPNQNPSGGFGYYDGQIYSRLMRKYPNNLLYSGSWNESESVGQGANGYYWTPVSYSGNDSYYFYLDDTIIRPGNSHGGKYNGYSIRCVSDN